MMRKANSADPTDAGSGRNAGQPGEAVRIAVICGAGQTPPYASAGEGVSPS